MTTLVIDLETIADTSRWTPPVEDPNAFPPPWACRIVCAGYLHLDDDDKLVELGAYTGIPSPDPDLRERSLLLALSRPLDAARRERRMPLLCTWNGRGFDMPVIVMRALCHAVPIPWWYAEAATRTRYREDRHLDLMDALSDHGAGKYVGLDAAAKLIGLPGKTDHGSNVAELHARGDLDAIVSYCMADVAQTALLLLRYRLLQLDLMPAQYAEREAALRSALALDPRLAALFPMQPIAASEVA